MKYENRIREQLKELREIKNLKQVEMAEILNITQSNYSQIENGKRQISVEQIGMLADEFDITIDWFYGRNVEQTKKLKNN
jgi:transcriptional regulator with XRE-family HTH domain